jgi:NADPH:quinone reductase-like Zn-dependent oxidoreductase
VLQLREVASPAVGDHDVLVRVHAASVGFGDTLVRNLAAVSPRRFHMPFLFWVIARLAFGVRRPRVRVLGSEFAGEVAEVGRAVTRFRRGDAVFGFSGPRMGAYAELLKLPEDGVLAPKPPSLSYAQAAAIPYGAVTALALLRKVALQPGQRVLVVGASGGIGPAVVQLARKRFGAEVAGVCGAARLDYVRSLGADLAIDYAREDFADRPETYDVVIDIPGKSSFSRCRRVLRPGGRLVLVSFKERQLLQALWTALLGDRKVVCVLVNERPEDLASVRELVEGGALTSVVDRTFPLELAAEAHRYAESGARRGPVVVAVSPSASAR